MSLLKQAMEKARSAEETAAVNSVAILSQNPQEAAMADYFSTDPLSGYDAAQIAISLFETRRLEELANFIKDKNLTPNIVLPNGLTLLQSSLLRYPTDADRVTCLLKMGANPNLFMRKIDEESFGNSAHRAAYHPLNYAFANCPHVTTPDVCRALRHYGASAEGLRNYFETAPGTGVADNEAKAALRKELIAVVPDSALMKTMRKDVDLSVMQKHMANVETQLAAAGFQIVSYTPPQPAKVRVAASNAMIPKFENFRVLTAERLREIYRRTSEKEEVAAALEYTGSRDSNSLKNYFFTPGSSLYIESSLPAKLSCDNPQAVFEWLPNGASVGTSGNNNAVAFIKPLKFIFVKHVGQNDFGVTIVGVYQTKAGDQFFFDPSIDGIRLLSQDDQKMSLADRSDILDDLNVSIQYLEIKDDPHRASLVPTFHERKFDAKNRPLGYTTGAHMTPPTP